jgi:hypothetical protein
MDTPAPVNLSNLTDILAKSRSLMKQTNDTPKSNRLNEDIEPVYKQELDDQKSFDPYAKVSDYTEEQVNKSGLPDSIKESFLKNRIKTNQHGLTNQLSLEQIEKITGNKALSKNIITESSQTQNSDMITISKTALKEMINESMFSFFKEKYDKTLTEETIKKTINVLIKEGKINTKRK